MTSRAQRLEMIRRPFPPPTHLRYGSRSTRAASRTPCIRRGRRGRAIHCFAGLAGRPRLHSSAPTAGLARQRTRSVCGVDRRAPHTHYPLSFDRDGLAGHDAARDRATRLLVVATALDLFRLVWRGHIRERHRRAPADARYGARAGRELDFSCDARGGDCDCSQGNSRAARQSMVRGHDTLGARRHRCRRPAGVASPTECSSGDSRACRSRHRGCHGSRNAA